MTLLADLDLTVDIPAQELFLKTISSREKAQEIEFIGKNNAKYRLTDEPNCLKC